VSEDRRGAYAVLAQAGVDAMRGAWPIYERSIARYFAAALSDDEMAILERLLSRIAAGLGQGTGV
jgi:DNA-binding MarR family transcriptional regulator